MIHGVLIGVPGKVPKKVITEQEYEECAKEAEEEVFESSTQTVVDKHGFNAEAI